jgi:Polysaccharide lyase
MATPNAPGSGYTLDWENPSDQVLPMTPPPGWDFDYDNTKPGRIGLSSKPPLYRFSFLWFTFDIPPWPDTCARFYLHHADAPHNYGVRSELSASLPYEPAGQERWYGFSVYLPSSWVNDVQPDIVAQGHHDGDGSPPLAVGTKDGQWRITRFDSSTSHGAYALGTWTDWVVHARWSVGEDGVLEMWRNAELVLKCPGTNLDGLQGQQQQIYMKIGIYKWPWNSAETFVPPDRTLFHDELRITDGSGSFPAVAPWQGPYGWINRRRSPY